MTHILTSHHFQAQGPRETQQDRFRVIAVGPVLFAMVADGMGGHDGGDIAAEQAVAAAERYLLSNQGSLEELVLGAVMEADQAVRAAATKTRRNEMGTTLLVAGLTDAISVIAHVGDCRAYLFTRDRVAQLTSDHTPYGESGNARPDRATGMLTQALGHGEMVDPEVVTVQMRPGSRLLLCSDGVYKVDESAVLRAAGSGDSVAEAVTCTGSALAVVGLTDNATVIAIDYGSFSGWNGGAVSRPARRRAPDSGSRIRPTARAHGGGAFMFFVGVVIATVLVVAIAERSGKERTPFTEREVLNKGDDMMWAVGSRLEPTERGKVSVGPNQTIVVFIRNWAGWVKVTITESASHGKCTFSPDSVRLTDSKVRSALGIGQDEVSLVGADGLQHTITQGFEWFGWADQVLYFSIKGQADRVVVARLQADGSMEVIRTLPEPKKEVPQKGLKPEPRSGGKPLAPKIDTFPEGPQRGLAQQAD